MVGSAASVVDFPEPVGPVTRIRPCRCQISCRTLCGIPSASMLGISSGSSLKAAASESRWK
jgi:hypothetical protein